MSYLRSVFLFVVCILRVSLTEIGESAVCVFKMIGKRALWLQATLECQRTSAERADEVIGIEIQSESEVKWILRD